MNNKNYSAFVHSVIGMAGFTFTNYQVHAM